ncbi:MAG TPA: protoporphyrinogen oxidase [Pirellulales bacterium]|nr:protoporphyrinogen oxidase [Pirellulales bacterium]
MTLATPGQPAPLRVAVIGGGISGLAAAHKLRELDPATKVTLFEAGDTLGGVVRTERSQGYLLEQSADSFITNVPWALDLCRRVGLADELIPTNEAYRRALVVRKGKLYPVPDGFTLLAGSRVWPILSTRVLSLRGKLRLLGEWFVPARRCAADENSDESVASFVRRRLGREAFERLAQPLVAGIYTADAEKLSLAAALPQFLEMERRHGSLIRALRRGAADRQESGARYSLFVTPRDGLAALVVAVAARLPAGCVELNAPVERLAARAGGGWTVSLAGRGEPREFDALIVAVPAPIAARLLQGAAADLAAALRQIPYAGSAIALAGYRREQVARPLDGFGFVVPEFEGREILAASFTSVKFAGRAPEGRVLLRVFFGGARRPDQVECTDDELRRIAGRELGELLGARGEPELFRVCRWRASMPQYHLGHLALVEGIESRVAQLPGLELAGNAYRGVGIPHCVHSGEQAAERIRQWSMVSSEAH